MNKPNLTLVQRKFKLEKRKRGWRIYNQYQCYCGALFVAREENVKLGNTKSCGCLLRTVLEARVTHGHSRKGQGSGTYKSWSCMLERCRNPKNNRYPIYGGRGITVCDRWLVFENFLVDMGERPEKRSIDRIDTNGNYEPGNCRWATAVEQANNRRPRGKAGQA